MKRKAIFLDRDGTLIEDVGYLKNPSEIVFYDNTFTALQLLQKKHLLFIITNQSGISKGALTEEEVNAVNNAILNRFTKESINIQEVFVCPHTVEDRCECRKPNSYFIQKAEIKYGLDLSKSFMIGDHPSDVYCAENAEVTGIYLLTGHGCQHLHEFKHKPLIKADILGAAKYINNIK